MGLASQVKVRIALLGESNREREGEMEEKDRILLFYQNEDLFLVTFLNRKRHNNTVRYNT